MTHTIIKRDFIPSIPTPKSLIAKASGILALWYDRHCERCQLAEMSADRLSDIGVTAEAARKEAAKRFWEA